jgi:hypothetical protein
LRNYRLDLKIARFRSEQICETSNGELTHTLVISELPLAVQTLRKPAQV